MFSIDTTQISFILVDTVAGKADNVHSYQVLFDGTKPVFVAKKTIDKLANTNKNAAKKCRIFCRVLMYEHILFEARHR